MSERFWSHVDRGAHNACWEWQAARNQSGHGRCGIPGTRKIGLAHRRAWELVRGPIPDGLCVLHRCDNPPCCNPTHLFLGTRADNNRDMDEKGRARRTKLGARQAAKTHCPAGHEYTDANTYRRRAQRECRTCVLARNEKNRMAVAPERSAKGLAVTVPELSPNENAPEGAKGTADNA